MDIPVRCYSCMSDMKGSTSCLSCGWQMGCDQDNILYLPQGHILNNRYLIGKVIGTGGFGIVYVAWDNNLDIKVAVKEFLPKEYAARSADHVSLTPYTGNASDEFSIGVEKFLDEAKALAKFQDHPGIVTVFESFQANNTAYMVMQFLDGMTLKEYLKRQPGEKMPFNIAVKAMTPIMDALREVHKAGFVHRDISPDNIFITRQKQIKLLDFGAARYAIGEHSKSLTSVLKHGYAPVEQYSSKGNQGPWSDVYATAATLYRAVTGIVPLDAMERIQEDTLKSPTELGVTIPSVGETAIMKGLALKAADRYENIHQFQTELFANNDASSGKDSQKEVEQPYKPQSQSIIECPECGAKNHLGPSDDRNALRCGKCKRELGVFPLPSTISTQTSSQDRNRKSSKDNQSVSQSFTEYGADSTNYRLLWLKIVTGIFFLIFVVGSLYSKLNKKYSAPASSPAPARTTIRQPEPSQNTSESIPESSAEHSYTPQPTYTPPPVVHREPDFGKYKYLATDTEGNKFYYDSETYRRYTNNNTQAVIVIVDSYGQVSKVLNAHIECDTGIMSINNGPYSQIGENTIGGAVYERFCNR